MTPYTKEGKIMADMLANEAELTDNSPEGVIAEAILTTGISIVRMLDMLVIAVDNINIRTDR